jgi:thiol:disulfide interchange protein DsbD
LAKDNRTKEHIDLFFPVSRFLGLCVCVAALHCFSVASITAQEGEDPSPHSHAELIPEVNSVRPGESFTVGLRLELDPGWHSYWLNPGDAGQPAAIEWDIPAGYRAGEIRWPYPHKVEESTVVSYGYDDEVFLLTEITVPRFLTIGQTVKFSAEAHWLVCENICLPAKADLEFEIQISEENAAPDPGWSKSFEETRNKIPVSTNQWTMTATNTEGGFMLQVESEHGPLPSFDGAFFYASERGVLEHGAAQGITHEGELVRISLTKSPYARGVPDRLTGVLVMPEAVELETGPKRAVAVDVPLSRGSGIR